MEKLKEIEKPLELQQDEMFNSEKIEKAFESIGIPLMQTKVYLDLLKNNESTVTKIAKRTKMHRANVYDTLTKLREKNLVYSTIKEGRKVFSALIADILLQEEKEKIENLKNVMNHLQKYYISGTENLNAKVYVLHGYDAMKNIFLSLLENKDPIWVYGIAEKEEISNLLINPSFHFERIKKKIPLKCLFHQNQIEIIKDIHRMKFTEARILSKAHQDESSQISQILSGNKLCLIVMTKPIHTIVIESSTIAKDYLDSYMRVWNYSKDL